MYKGAESGGNLLFPGLLVYTKGQVQGSISHWEQVHSWASMALPVNEVGKPRTSLQPHSLWKVGKREYIFLRAVFPTKTVMCTTMGFSKVFEKCKNTISRTELTSSEHLIWRLCIQFVCITSFLLHHNPMGSRPLLSRCFVVFFFLQTRKLKLRISDLPKVLKLVPGMLLKCALKLVLRPTTLHHYW